jgi:segregation and condensation protein B
MMNKQQVRAVVEALLLAAENPVSPGRLQTVLGEEASPELIGDALRTLELEYAGESRGIHLVRIAGGYQLRTNPAFGDQIRHFFESQPVRLSRAAMETLAIVAYRQPLTRAEIEDVRGVNSSGVLSTLRECDLVDIVGQLDDIGKPHLYGTTPRFLEFFGLDALSDLPTLEASELEALIEMHSDIEAPETTDLTTKDAEPTEV